MKGKLSKIIVVILLLALLSLSCQMLSFLSSEEESPEPDSAAEEAEPREEKSEKEPEAETLGIGLGEEYRSEEGGYSFSTIPDYEVEEFFGFGMMTAPGGDEAGITLVGSPPEQEDITLDDLYADVIGDVVSGSEDIQITNKRSITVAGIPGYAVDVYGKVEGEYVAGRVVVVVVSPEHEFRMMGYAPRDRWASELDGYFEAVLGTVQFFEPTITEISVEEEEEEEVFEAEETRQWASTATASSQYDTSSWAAMQAAGAPDTLIDYCGTMDTAWASYDGYTVEWIELEYDQAVIPTEINIIQTSAPNQVVRVEVIDTGGFYQTVYTGVPEKIIEGCPYTLSVSLDVDYEVNGVKITIDQTVLEYPWNEIDAVELVGYAWGEIVITAPSETGTTEGVLWRAGGESGTEEGQFGGLGGMDIGPDGHVYVADESFGVRVHDADDGSLVALISHNDLWQPSDVQVAPDGTVYVADWGANEVFIFSSTGELLTRFGEEGNGPGQFGTFSPDSLAISPDNELFVVDEYETDAGEERARIQVFSSEGAYLREFQLDYEDPEIEDMDFGPDGNLYLIDWLQDAILAYSPEGTLLERIGEEALDFTSPQDVAIDDMGNFYVGAWSPSGVIKLDPNGNQVAQFGANVEDGEKPWPEGGFYTTSGVTVLPNGSTVFVSDWSGYYSYITAFMFK